MGISRATASKWANRHRKFGETGLIDCSSAPVRQPTATPGETAARIEQLRREEKWSASRIAYELGADRSPVSRRTITRHLAQLRLNRRRFIDPNGETNREIRTITAKHPGHMVHLDVKKVGRITDGGGWRVHGKNSSEARAASRAKTRGARAGYAYLRSAIDGHTRLAYTEFTGERTGCHRRRVLEPRPRMVCQARHHEDRTDHHRQRRLLSLVRLRNSPARHRAQANAAVYAQVQRQSRALQPGQGGRVPLRQNLDLRTPARESAGELEPALQLPPAAWSARRQTGRVRDTITHNDVLASYS